jgi:hypothetical protein
MSVQFFRLWPRRPPDGSLPLGLSCDDEGLLLAGNCRLIQACLDRDGHLFYRARAASELNALLLAERQPRPGTRLQWPVLRRPRRAKLSEASADRLIPGAPGLAHQIIAGVTPGPRYEAPSGLRQGS